jgi:hypothetical protein
MAHNDELKLGGKKARPKMSRILRRIFLTLALTVSLSSNIQAEEGAAILRIDTSFLILDPDHDLVGKLDEAQLAIDVLEKASELSRSGPSQFYRKISITTLGDAQATVQLGRQISVARQLPPGGRAASNSTQSVGTLLRITPRASGEQIVLNLAFDASYLQFSDVVVVAGPEVQKVTVHLTVAIEPEVPTVVYDSSVGGDTKSRAICVMTVTKQGNVDLEASPNSGARVPAGSSGPSDANYLAYARAQIAKYDTNGGGALREEEWKAMATSPRAADTNGDGSVTAEELARWFIRK